MQTVPTQKTKILYRIWHSLPTSPIQIPPWALLTDVHLAEACIGHPNIAKRRKADESIAIFLLALDGCPFCTSRLFVKNFRHLSSLTDRYHHSLVSHGCHDLVVDDHMVAGLRL